MAQILANLTPVENLLALVTAANPSYAIEQDDVVFGSPVAGEFAGGFNTSIEMTAVANSGYRGQQTIYYNRRALLDSNATPKVDFNIPLGVTLENMLPSVAQAFGLIASEIEWDLDITTALPTITEQTMPGRIKSKAGSLTYLPDDGLSFSLKYPLVIDFVITAGSSPETGDPKYPTSGGYGYCNAAKVFYTNGYGSVDQATVDGITLAQFGKKPYDQSTAAIHQVYLTIEPLLTRAWLDKVEIFDLSQAGEPLVVSYTEAAAAGFFQEVNLPTGSWVWQSNIFVPVVGRRYRVRVWKKP